MTLRRVAEDFRVREVLQHETLAAIRPEWSKDAPFAVFLCEKRQKTTPEASIALGRLLGVKPGSVAHAGLKDKHAVTTQHLSVKFEDARDLARLEGPGLSYEPVGFAPRALVAADIGHNAFEIVVRGLDRQRVGEMERLAHEYRAEGDSNAATLWFTNYFGSQRFGSARHKEGFAARSLIAGDYVEGIRLLIATPARKDTGTKRAFTRLCATKWGRWEELARELPACADRRPIEHLAAGKSPTEAFASISPQTQQFAVDAFQSWLWNETAALLTMRLAGSTTCAVMDDHGILQFASPATVRPALESLGGVDRLVLPTASMELRPRAPWAEPLATVLAKAGITLKDLQLPGLRRPMFRSVDRLLIASATDFSMSRAEHDEFAPPRSPKMFLRRVSFTLPSGSYATVLLRALGE
ncbi:MAG: tRNA pseudouridine(13) synthase TruD [Phycisphaerales bacterium]|nr:MAG: tRNA pseudouridine(13) synthase TruD [Phycisphaerales bacterium]